MGKDTDPRVARADAIGLNAEGIDTREEFGQTQLQATADKIEELGFIPSDGRDLGLSDEENLALLDAHVAAHDASVAEHTAPQPEGEAGEEDEGLAHSASREEWNAYADSLGLNSSEYSNKEDLIEAVEAYKAAQA
jgi:hypothetical protein